MKATITVNLNGLLFHIEEEAYKTLKKYLDKTAGYFKDQSESKEILNDLESRIAELLKERLGKTREVVNIEDIEYIISVLGEPEEIGTAGESTKDYHGKKSRSTFASKRLYRDPDNKILGGVCSGIGAYFHVDPVIIRVIFLIAFLGFGFGIIIYIILWIVIPEAITPVQKCEMRGEPINLSNIAGNVKDEFNNVKDKMNL
ncbi:PspC domain-containing protein [Bacteroidota bacterium]